MTDNTLDLTNLAKDLFAASENIGAATQDLLVNSGSQIEAEAQSTVAVKTGALKNSITMTVESMKVTVGPTLSYGTYVEYGTGTRGEFHTAMYEIKPKNGNYLVFNVGGRKVFARSVKHPGMRAQPFMRPAAEKLINELPGGMAEIGVLMITGTDARALS